MRPLAPLIAALFAMSATAQDRVIRLYNGPAPGSEHWKQSERENNHNQWQTRVVYNVADPTLTVLLPDPARAIGTGVVICPGGGFHALSIDSEGLEVAHWLKDRGVACFILKYRLVECQTQDPTQEIMTKTSIAESVMPIVPLALADGLAAVGHVRRHAKDYAVRPDQIGILGFSAGGTVAAAVAYNYQSENRPDFVAPIYLAYNWVPRKTVPADAPPMFILAATDDPLGLGPQSAALYRDWTAAGKSAELVLYAKGGHGFGMRKQNLPSDRWIERFADWLGANGWLPPATTR